MKRLLISLYTVFGLFTGFAQNAIWKHYGIKEGLYEPTITSITQDKFGVLWLASQTGLTRFDGVSFTKIKPAGNEQPYLNTIIAGKDGAIWAGSRTGLWKYDPSSQVFKRVVQHEFQINHLSWNSDSTQMLISGFSLWIMKQEGKLEQISTDLSVIQMAIFSGKDYIASDYMKILSIGQNRIARELFKSTSPCNFVWYPPENCFLVISGSGLWKMKADGSKTKVAVDIPLQKVIMIPNGTYVDKNNKIWINTFDTLYRFSSLKDQNPSKYYWIRENPHTITKTICRFMDRDGNLWVGNEGKGISVLAAKADGILYNTFAEMDSRYIWTTKYDAQNRTFYYGSEKGLQIYDLRQRSPERKIIPNPPVKTQFTITNIQDYDDRNLVISTYGSGAWLLDKTTFKYRLLSPEIPTQVNGVYKNRDGRTYVLSYLGLYRNEPGSGKFTMLDINAFNFLGYSEAGGNYYFSDNVGMYQLDPQDNFKRILRFEASKEIKSSVLCIHALKNGNIYLGTINDGLFVYNLKRKKVSKVMLDPDPASIYGMSMINEKEMLLTTNNGIYLFDITTGKSKAYNITNLLPFNDFSQFGYFASPQMISLCGSEGIFSGSPQMIRNLFTESAPILVEKDGQFVKKLIIPAGEQSFSVFVGIGLKSVQYNPDFEYRLKGLEEKWHPLDPSGNLTYNYIPPGNYALEIRMHDPNHILPDQLESIRVEILPLWWQTFWFQGAMYLISLIAMVFLIRYLSQLRLNWKIRRMEAEQKINNERLRISRELHDNVGSQLSYLITGLEASEMMLQKENTQSLTRNLENLQESARESMQQLRDAIWALNKEEISSAILIERFAQWAYKMSEQHEISIDIVSDIDREIELDSLKTLNIFRILQEAVHNILKHAQASEANIRFLRGEDQLEAIIRDNGKGFNDHSDTGNGLKNMKIRAKELGGTLEISSETGKGTTLHLKIPVNTPKS